MSKGVKRTVVGPPFGWGLPNHRRCALFQIVTDTAPLEIS